MDSARLTFLFYRYVNRTCTEEEREEFLQLVGDPVYDAQVRDLMKNLWETAPSEKLSISQSDEILLQILSQDEVPAEPEPGWSTWSKIAAVAAILVMGALAAYFIGITPAAEQTAAAKPMLNPSEHRIVKLPDGSVVFLNEGSTLEYPNSFDDKATRTVFLTGEGYFDVRHHPSKKFIVQTGNLKTTVLGTAFNIRAYPMDKDITVTVTRGKVRVSDDKKFLGIITPDQQITFDKHHQAAARQAVDSKNAIAWAERDIFFDDVTMAEAVKELERRFHVSVQFGNEELKDCRFTATFVRGEDLEQILTVICEFNGSHFRHDGPGMIRVEGSGC